VNSIVSKLLDYGNEDHDRHQLVSSYRTMSVECNPGGYFLYVPLPCSKNIKYFILKSDANRRKTYEARCVPFMGANQLAAAGFYLKTCVIFFFGFLCVGNSLVDGWKC